MNVKVSTFVGKEEQGKFVASVSDDRTLNRS